MRTRRCASPALFLGLVLAVSALPVRAGPFDLSSEPPERGGWRGQPLGTFVVVKRSVRDMKTGAISVSFQKSLLVGSSENGREFLAVYNSERAAGPWAYSHGSGGGDTFAEQPGVATVEERDDWLALGDGKIRCVVRTFSGDTDSGKVDGEEWRLAGSALVLRSTIRVTSIRHGVPSILTLAQTPLGIEKVTLGGRTLTGYRISFRSEYDGGKRVTTSEAVLCADLPDLRFSTRAWNGDQPGEVPEFVNEVVSVGVDADLLAVYRKENPTPAQRMADAAEKQKRDRAAHFEQVNGWLSSDDAPTRAMALRSFGSTSDPSPEARSTVARLPDFLDDPDAEVRRVAALACAKHGLPVGKRLAELASADAEGLLYYARAAAMLESEDVLDVLLLGAASPNEQVRSVVARALSMSADPAAEQAVERLLADPQYSVRLGFVMDNWKPGATCPQAITLRLSRDPNTLVRSAAARQLAGYASPESRARLAELLGDADPRVVQSAIASLARVEPGQRERDALLAKAKSEHAAIAAAAMSTLAHLGDGRIIPIAVSILADPQSAKQNPDTFGPPAMIATQSLLVLGTESAVLAMLDATTGPNAQYAVDAVRHIKSPQAGAALWRAYLNLQRTQTTDRDLLDSVLEALRHSADEAVAADIEKQIPGADTADAQIYRRLAASIRARLANPSR